ncbi:hypothetical protein ALC57_14404, partial [Trachymyrmex cornetzi]
VESKLHPTRRWFLLQTKNRVKSVRSAKPVPTFAHMLVTPALFEAMPPISFTADIREQLDPHRSVLFFCYTYTYTGHDRSGSPGRKALIIISRGEIKLSSTTDHFVWQKRACSIYIRPFFFTHVFFLSVRSIRGLSITVKCAARDGFHFNVCSRTEWEWRSIKRQLATAIATAVIAERDPRDDRFLNKNRQPDRSSLTDTGPHHSPSVQSETPIVLMYSNLMSLYEMAKMQHNDASSTLKILLRKYIINFTLWHEIALSSLHNNDHQGLHISPLAAKEPAGLAGNLSEFELQFRGV